MRTTILVIVVTASLFGCAKKNELPEDFRGTYTMTRLLGQDNAQIAVDATSLTMSECDVNCPDLVMRFTSVTCTTDFGLDTCQVESADCTGTVSERSGTPRTLDVELTAKPGLTGAAAEHRQVNCYQHSGAINQ
jgi:hypothetical protein